MLVLFQNAGGLIIGKCRHGFWAHKQIYDGLALREGVIEADAFMQELRREFPEYDDEDLAALAESVDNTHDVPFVDADALPVNGKWKVCASYAWKRREHISVLEARTLVATVRHAIAKGNAMMQQRSSRPC